MMEAELASKPLPTDAQVREFYDKNPDKFETARASHILFRVDEKADDAAKKKALAEAQAVLKQVKGGADFAGLAKKHSADGSAQQGGDLGVFNKGQMVPEFDQAVFSMLPGQISDIVTTQFGLSHHQGDGPRGRSVRSGQRQDQGVPDRAAEARARAGLHRLAETESQDRGARLSEEVLSAAAEALKRGESVALVTVVRAQGSTPQRAGAKMLVWADGRTVGTIGGGCYENDAFWKAREAITSGKPSLVHYELNDDFAQENGLICGGRMDVHIDPLLPAPRLHIVGAGHVGLHLAKVAADAGFHIHVVDDRDKFANAERFPGAEVVVEPIPDWLHRADLPPTAYVVVVTRGHTHDLDAMRALAARDLKYLGLIGSRAKVARIYVGAPGRRDAARMPRAGARPDRARDRRRHAGGDRHQHPRRAHRRPERRRHGTLSMKVGRASNP